MRSIKNSKAGICPEVFGSDIPIEPQENFVNNVYFTVDEAAASELARLQRDEDIIPPCKMGCCQCCRYLILMNIAEAHTLAQYVKRELTVDQINELRLRTLQWHEWDNSRRGRYPSSYIGAQSDLSNYEHFCPLLIDGACIAYPVRPVVCRTHFVCSHPMYCFAANDPESTVDDPVVLSSVVTATSQISKAIRRYIESVGMDYSRSMMLLPHWLAIEMGWDFAISE